jgi:ABC-2 type transport system ATP-binding protein
MLTTAATNAAPPTTLVELAGLEKSFGLVHAVCGIDLTVAPGEVVAVLGPNGAGKSTTLDMLLGLTVPDRGRVSLLGQTPEEAIRTGTVGAMLQTGGLVRDLTVRELLAMIGSLYPAPLDLDDLLALTGVTEFADQRTHKLSGGQTQRARFALALVSDPDLLVLDEPTVAMDVKSRQVFWSSMRALGRRAKTVIFATHYLEEADLYADRIVLLAQGRVVADGPTTEIKAMVGTRTIEATLPGADPAALTAIPGVSACQVRGDVVTLTCADADTALRGLLPAYPAMHDIEVRGAGLDEAFLQLTTDTTAEEGA